MTSPSHARSRNPVRRRPLGSLWAASLLLLTVGCGDGDTDDNHDHDAHPHDASPQDAGDGGVDAGDGGGSVAHTVFLTEGATLVAFDVQTGTARPGTIANVAGPTDMQALASGHLLVNLTDRGEVLVVDAISFREVTRISTSSMGATRPVHSFVTPLITGKQFWVANNDGGGTTATNSVVFIDIVPGSATFLKVVGELGLGIGHHKNAFSPEAARVSITNIADCSNVLQVIDYSDASKPTLVKKWSAAELDATRDCGMQGAAPHGGVPAANGHGYHNLTGWGVVAAVDQISDPPTVKLLATKGNGAGYSKAARDGVHVFTLQRTPREGDTMRPGVDCQIGQLVSIDTNSDTVVSETPILLTGAGCTSKLPAHAALAGPDHMKVTGDGLTLFVTSQAAPPTGGTDPAYSDQLLVFDLADPGMPVQKASITIGKHSGHRAMTLSGDDKVLFVVNANDKTVSQIDVKALTVTRTLTLTDVPRQVATFGSTEGPSAQTGPH